jgi:hypothetical protein
MPATPSNPPSPAPRRSAATPLRNALRPARRHIGGRILAPLVGLLPFLLPGCTTFDDTRPAVVRGTLGEELYGVLCDRVGAGALREDLTGASFHGLCHKDATGAFGAKVDATALPQPVAGAVDEGGKAVPLDVQQANQARAIARVELFAAQRAKLITAFDAAFPDTVVAVKDLNAANELDSCLPPEAAGAGNGKLLKELEALLGRFTKLYIDGTIPESTRSLSQVFSTLAKDKEARNALQRMGGRKGYRPLAIALGMARPAVAYPRLRDMSEALVRTTSSVSDPFAADGKPGAAYTEFNKLLEIGSAELANASADPVAAALTATTDSSGKSVISRPRTTLEMANAAMLAENDAFIGGPARYIVARDRRGWAQPVLTGGKVTAPFVDANNDGLADVDPLGAFVSAGAAIPAPFFAADEATTARDSFGRATTGSNALLFRYIDTSKTLTAAAMRNMPPLFNPDPRANHETMMDALAGLYVLAGARADLSKKYANGTTVAYKGFNPDNSPTVDFAHALLQVLADKNSDDTISLVRALFVDHEKDLARLIGAVSKAKDKASARPDGVYPANSTFWDEFLDIFAEMSKDPGLIADLLDALSNDASLDLAPDFSLFAKSRDTFTYDHSNLDGPPKNLTTNSNDPPKSPVDRSKPDSGDNRSLLQRVFGLVAETDGVASCNRPGAQVFAKGIPIAGSITLPPSYLPPFRAAYGECEVFKIENLATFFLDNVAGSSRGKLIMRQDLMRNGVVGIGATTVDTLEKSAGFRGFWTASDSKELIPKPQYSSRLVFWDPNDTQNPDSTKFIKGLNPDYFGTNLCQERVLADPCDRGSNGCVGDDVALGGQIKGLRTCAAGDTAQARHSGVLFAMERVGFYAALQPLMAAFAKHGREDLFTKVAIVAHKHWQSNRGTTDECRMAGGKTCSKDGLSSYESSIGDVLDSDMLPALINLSKALKGMRVRHCDTADASGACTKTRDIDAYTVLAQATQALGDPDYSAAAKIAHRNGDKTSKRNDGGVFPQTTPLLLIVDALVKADATWAAWDKAHPEEKGARVAQWRRARSQLVDQFLGTTGDKSTAAFADPMIAKGTPILVDLLRSQLWARCPTSFVPPYDRCTWGRDTLPKNVADTLTGPLVGSGLDVAEKIRADVGARREIEAFMKYMTDGASTNDALAATLASSTDLVQVLADDQNLVPFLHALAPAMSPVPQPATDGRTAATKSLIDAQLSLLGKVSGKYMNDKGEEICSREYDPNQVLPLVLQNLVTPLTVKGYENQTPLDILMDVVADLNRVAPEQPKPRLDEADYKSVADAVVDFLSNNTRGLEQFYAIVRNSSR